MKHYKWHRFIFFVLRITVGPIIRRVVGYKCKKYKGPDAPTLVISNHNSDLDPAWVGLGFSRHMYFLTSEHALRNGFSSTLIKFVFSPVHIDKTKADIASIKEMIRRLKAGANVCLFAEGNRSFTGATAPLAISTAKLVKASGADLITFRIEGGYFTTPRWSRRMRKGKMTGGVVNKYTAAELKGMTYEQVLGAIERDIYVDAYEGQKAGPVRYRGENLAENIETALYMCPGCGRIGTIRSEGDRFFCDCGLRAQYTETGYLEGGSLPFSTITEWGRWQEKKLEETVQNAGDGAICACGGQHLFRVRAATDKAPVGEGAMSIDREALRCAGMDFPIKQITRVAVAGQMTLLFALKGGETYEVRSEAPRSALVYREIFRILTGIGD